MASLGGMESRRERYDRLATSCMALLTAATRRHPRPRGTRLHARRLDDSGHEGFLLGRHVQGWSRGSALQPQGISSLSCRSRQGLHGNTTTSCPGVPMPPRRRARECRISLLGPRRAIRSVSTCSASSPRPARFSVRANCSCTMPVSQRTWHLSTRAIIFLPRPHSAVRQEEIDHHSRLDFGQ